MNKKNRQRLANAISYFDGKLDLRDTVSFIDQLVTEEVGKKQLNLFTQEEWDLLVDAVAYHSTCKECDMVKNQDLLEKVAVYQEKLQKLQSGEEVK